MVYALRLYDVDAVNVPAFTAAFEEEPPWRHLSYELDGHLHTGLLHRSSFEPSFLSLTIWNSEEHFLAAENTAEFCNFNHLLRALASSYQSIGVFRYCGQPDIRAIPVRSLRIPAALPVSAVRQ